MFGENSPSKKFHRERVLFYMVEEGTSEAEAIDRANADLSEWNQPLALPDLPAEQLI